MVHNLPQLVGNHKNQSKRKAVPSGGGETSECDGKIIRVRMRFVGCGEKERKVMKSMRWGRGVGIDDH